MKRYIAMALLVCSSTSVVLSHRFSLAQQDAPEIERKVLSKVALDLPRSSPQDKHPWSREAGGRRCARW
jgi:hypothetical protein